MKKMIAGCVLCAGLFVNSEAVARDGMVAIQLNENWRFRQAGKSEWMPATVPGCNHTDLLANAAIKNPFWRMNEADLQWIDKESWEYESVFSVDPELLEKDRVALHFIGLDTYADVSLNGTPILSADNMFREWWVDVKAQLKPGANELRILFRSPIIEGIKKYDTLDYVLPVSPNDCAGHGQVPGSKQVSVFTRKAGYHFGWDWGPRLVSSGIWKPVVLTAWNTARIHDLHFQQHSVSKSAASLTAVFEIEAEQETKASLQVSADGVQIAELPVSLLAGTNRYQVDFEIADPELWWCNGLGEARLYSLTGNLIANGSKSGKTKRIGIRTIELVRDKDEQGRSFYFKVNGVPVFMKGANYIPNDIYPARVSDEKYRQVIHTAQTSNFNMLRVWGGGIYEKDLFYDLCDEAGILVWQDFMFACAMFPSDQAFLENVRQEAIENVKRLRDHPSIALWCGNNENLSGWYRWGWKESLERDYGKEVEDQVWKGYEKLFHGVLGDVVSTFDPSRAYWPSSPSAGPGRPSELAYGDEHYWGVWADKKPYETYSTHIARFMSEYGFQSFPELRTINEFALPEDYGFFTDVMKAHQRSQVGNGTIEYYMLRDYPKPKDFESSIYVGQLLQAEIIQYAVEAHRRAMPFCMGSLYWQLNDCWPVASWSSMDSSLRWKAQQYFMKKVFKPVLVSPFMKDNVLSVYVVNDHQRSLDSNLRMRLIDFEGKELWGKTVPVAVPANSSGVYFSIPRAELIKEADDTHVMLVAELVEKEITLAEYCCYFRKVKDLVLPTPAVRYDVKPFSGGFEIVLKSDLLAKNLYLSLGDADGFFEDNYFDLLPNRTVPLRLITNLNEADMRKHLKIRTLNSAF